MVDNGQWRKMKNNGQWCHWIMVDYAQLWTMDNGGQLTIVNIGQWWTMDNGGQWKMMNKLQRWTL